MNKFADLLARMIPDKTFLKIKFRIKMGRKLDLKNPQTFNEKLQWLKLYDRNPLYTTLVDKQEVKKYISEKIGSEYVIPTLGVWDKPEDIDFDSLPNQFVMKCTHDSGGLVICKDKSKLDVEQVKKKMAKTLKLKYYYMHREWPYKNVKPKIFAEKYMEQKQEDGQECLTDYKFFCFDGKVKVMYIANEKANPPSTDYFDVNFNHIDLITRDKNALIPPPKPEQFEKMVELAETLSKGIPCVRVDFYYVNKQIYFGEFTFYHNAGFCSLKPYKWETTLGSWIKLPEKKK